MPRGVYDRSKVKEFIVAENAAISSEALSSEPGKLEVVKTSLAGRTVHRVILHNGVSVSPPPKATNEKSMFHRGYPGAKPMNRPVADEMLLTPAGVYARFGTYEKLVPYANVYECDLAPET